MSRNYLKKNISETKKGENHSKDEEKNIYIHTVTLALQTIFI